MNLKPMDENTLKFLKALVATCEKMQAAPRQMDILFSADRMWVGKQGAYRDVLLTAILTFSDDNAIDIDDANVAEFMEAIKNADTDQ